MRRTSSSTRARSFSRRRRSRSRRGDFDPRHPGAVRSTEPGISRFRVHGSRAPERRRRLETHVTKLTPETAGTVAIAPTPFHDDGRIDERSIDRLTDFYAEVGCEGVTVLGI